MRQKELLIISITIFLTIVTWMIADIYQASGKQNSKFENRKQTRPINIKIDTEVFQHLEDKR